MFETRRKGFRFLTAYYVWISALGLLVRASARSKSHVPTGKAEHLRHASSERAAHILPKEEIQCHRCRYLARGKPASEWRHTLLKENKMGSSIMDAERVFKVKRFVSEDVTMLTRRTEIECCSRGISCNTMRP